MSSDSKQHGKGTDKLYFTGGHGKDQAQVAGELRKERGVDHHHSQGTSGQMNSPVSLIQLFNFLSFI